MAAGSRGDLPAVEPGWAHLGRAALFVPLRNGSGADPCPLHVLQAELCSGLWQSLRRAAAAAAAEDNTSPVWAGFPAPAADSHSPDPETTRLHPKPSLLGGSGTSGHQILEVSKPLQKTPSSG